MSQWGTDSALNTRHSAHCASVFQGPAGGCLRRPPMRRHAMTSSIVLGLGHARRHITGSDRPNIRYTVLEKHKPFEQLLRFLDGRH